MLFEEVCDFFYDCNNYIYDLDMVVEWMFIESGMWIGGLDIQLVELMWDWFGILVVIDDNLFDIVKCCYYFDIKVFWVVYWLMFGQCVFQIVI